MEFLIDSGSTVSIIPLSYVDNDEPATSRNLFALNQTEVKTYGKRNLTIDIGLSQKEMKWNFIIADTATAIIGADFLSYYKLAIDVGAKRLLETEKRNVLELAEPKSEVSHKPPCQALIVKEQCVNAEVYKQMVINDFPSLLLFKPPTNIANDICHVIKTNGKPIRSKVRRLSPEMTKIAKEEIDKLLDAKIIRPGTNPWGSPIHMVKKKQPGKYRLTVDFRALNAVTEPDSYPLPILNDFVNSLHGCKIFSLIDFKSAFYQIPMHPDSVNKTCTITPFGSFVWDHLPFGLRNSAQCFQRFINQVTSDFGFVFVYLDDVLIFSPDHDTHLTHLRKLLERFSEYSLTINLDKCKFGVSSLNYLGHHIDATGIKPIADKVQAIVNFPKPSNMRQLRRLIGMIAFYKKFIPNCSEITKPIFALLSPHKYSKKAIEWTKDADDAFQEVLNKLCSPVTLAFPVENAPTYLVSDASNVAAGAVLHQKIDGELRPLAFFSRALNKAQLKYSVLDKELTAMYMAVKHFKYFLEGHSFKIVTDQKSITRAILAPSTNLSPRQSRYIDFIAQYSTDVNYISGSKNVVADCLSRTQCNALFEELPPVSLHEMAAKQQADASISNLMNSNTYHSFY